MSSRVGAASAGGSGNGNSKSHGKLEKIDRLLYAATNPANPMVVNTIFVCEEGIANNDMIRLITWLVEYAPRLRCVVADGEWKEFTDFDASKHYHEEKVQQGSTILGTLSKIISDPLPKDLPLFHWHLIRSEYAKDDSLPDLASKKDFVLCRVHHSVADGLALVQLAEKIFDWCAEQEFGAAAGKTAALPEVGHEVHERKKKRRKKPSVLSTVGSALYMVGSIPWSMGKIATLGYDKPNMFKIKDKHASPDKNVAWSKPMPLPALKLVARKNDSTINDVIVSLASGAMREYCKRHKPDQLGNLNGIKAIIPVSLRSLKIKDKIKLDNQVSCVFLEIPAEEEDIMKRLKKTKMRMDSLKASPDVLVTYSLLNFAANTFSLNTCTELQESWYDKCTLVLSNVPGRKTCATLCGKKVCNMFPWVPMMGNGGFGLLCYSYNDHLTITVQTDKKLDIDSREVCRLYFQQYEQILKENLSAEEIRELHDNLYQQIWEENKKAGRSAEGGGAAPKEEAAIAEEKVTDEAKPETDSPVIQASVPEEEGGGTLEFKTEVDEEEILNPGEKDDERTSSRKKLPALSV